eukprot:gene12850-biopygen8866
MTTLKYLNLLGNNLTGSLTSLWPEPSRLYNELTLADNPWTCPLASDHGWNDVTATTCSSPDYRSALEDLYSQTSGHGW